jgi:hypothetical protein
MSFRISNFRAFGPKVVELCVCGLSNFGGFWGGRLPGVVEPPGFRLPVRIGKMNQQKLPFQIVIT